MLLKINSSKKVYNTLLSRKNEKMTFLETFHHVWKKGTKSYQDIYSVLESVNWIWRGSSILRVVPEGPVGHRKYVNSKLLIAYDILWLIIFTSSYIRLFYDEYRIEIAMNFGTNLKVTMFFREIFNWITMVDVIFWRMIVNKQFIEAIDSIAKQDIILNNLGCGINHKSHSKVIGIFVRTYFFTYASFSCHELLYKWNFTLLLDYITWWFPLIIHKVSICFFSSLVWLLGVRFKALNKKLQFLVQSSAPHSQININPDECIQILRTIGNVHAHLCKIGNNLNHIFIITLVTSAVEAFILLTLSLYNFITEIKIPKDFLSFMESGMFMISCSLSMITIVLICDWTKNQASAAEDLIHRIEVGENNNILSDLIQIFSMQMHHQKLSFSVGGLFTLDPALLQAITAAITTNLIILIQFGQMETILLYKPIKP